MARVHAIEGEGEVAERLRHRRGGQLTPLDRALLHSPPLADGWNTLLGAVRTQLSLAEDLRELAILRVAALNGAEYEWRAHEPVALRAGLSPAQVEALREGAGTEALSAVQRACLAYTDAMTREVRVAEPLFTAVRAHLDERELVELTATVGAYNLVSRFLVALQIGEPEPDEELTA